jgi:endonuclease-3 related protein
LSKANATIIAEIYDALYRHFGPQHWWPAESPFEVVVGAVLTQNTNWSNVTKAIREIQRHGVLSFEGMSRLTAEEIAPLIKASGYYNLKAKRLKNLLNMIEKVYREFSELLEDDILRARENLLGVTGVGQETADSILLYACNKPVFVVDAYTHRVLHRHFLVAEESSYDDLQAIFTSALEEDLGIYQEYHALLVKTAATYCKKKKPLCETCPLKGINW